MTYLNEIVLYGGIPTKRIDMIADLERKAKKLDPANWLRLRDIYLVGHESQTELKKGGK